LAPTLYIDLPSYSHKSNGIRCLYELALELANQGIVITGVMRNPADFRYALQQAPQAIKNLPMSPAPNGTSEDLYLCSETVPFGHLKTARRLAMRIAWWQLAPFGLLGKTHYPQLGEHLLPFSSYSQPEVHQHFYFQPPLDQAWAAALKLPWIDRARESFKIAIYPGKGRLRRLPDNLLTLTRASEILLITRDQPQTREQLFGLLSQCDGLISFDELSQLNLEAASLQIPVFLANRLFPDQSMKNFVIKRLRDWLTSNPHEFIEMIQARSKDAFTPWEAEELMIANRSTVSAFRSLANGGLPETLIQSQYQIERLKIYSSQLKNARAIIANQKIGMSGGALLGLGDYLEYASNPDSQNNKIFLKIRFLDAFFGLVTLFPFLTIGFWACVKRLYLRLSRHS
jgi:hypothetical protein